MKLFVPGIPKAQQRPRAFVPPGSRKVRIYEQGTAEAWKGNIALSFRQVVESGPPITGPVALKISFLMPRPKKYMRKKDPEGTMLHTKKPDADNLAKAAMDALTQIGLWVDDTQVCKLYVEKAYHEKTGRPGAWIEIKELEGI